MLRFIRVIAGADLQFDEHLRGVLDVYLKAFEFYPDYAAKIASLAHGDHPPGAEAILLAAVKKHKVIGFTLAYYFSDLKAGYLDYIASDPTRAARGIGGAIYETMRDDLKKRGSRRLFFESLPDEPGPHVNETLLLLNKKRLAFYEGLGARPIIGTNFEKTVTPYNLGDPGFLMHDAMGNAAPLSRKKLRAVIERILLAKTGLGPEDALVRSIVDSVKDDPVIIRPPRNSTGARAPLPKFTRPLDLVVTADEAPSIEHSPFRGYFERPARVSAIRQALNGLAIRVHKAAQLGKDHIEAVQDRRMVRFLRESETKIADKRILYPEIFPSPPITSRSAEGSRSSTSIITTAMARRISFISARMSSLFRSTDIQKRATRSTPVSRTNADVGPARVSTGIIRCTHASTIRAMCRP